MRGEEGDRLQQTATAVETKTAPFKIVEIKEDGGEGIVTGYASIFGNRDQGGDIVEPNAFDRTLRERGKEIMYLPPHDWSAPLADIPGMPTDIHADTKGLHTTIQMFLETKAGHDTFAVIKRYQANGTPFGMSFGYKPVKVRREFSDDEKEETRFLEDIELIEIGHVPIPMNREARTVGVKDASGGGLTLTDHMASTDGLLAELSGYVARFRSLAEHRAKDARDLPHRERLEQQLERIASLSADLKALLAGEAKTGGDEVSEKETDELFARFQQSLLGGTT